MSMLEHLLYTDNQSENKRNTLDSTRCGSEMMKPAQAPPETTQMTPQMILSRHISVHELLSKSTHFPRRT